MIKIEKIELTHIGVIMFLFFLASISPIFSLFVSLLLIRTRFFFPFILFTSFYFGWFYLPQLDLLNHYGHFKSLVGKSLKESWIDSETIHLGKEVYPVLFKFLLAKVSDSPNLFSAMSSVIYTFIFLKVLFQIKKISTGKISGLGTLLFLGVIFTVEYYWFLGFRYWTGAFVFVFFYLKYLETNKQLYLLLSFSSILFHFAHITLCGILLLNYLLKDRYYIRFIILFFSVFVRFANAPIVHIISKMEFLRPYVKESMLNEKIVESVAERVDYIRTYGNLFYQIRLDILFLTCIVVFLVFFKKNKKIIHYRSNIFGLVILLLSVANFGFSSLTFYERVFKLSVLIFFIALYLYSTENLLKLSIPQKASLYLLISISIIYAILTSLVEQRDYIFDLDLWLNSFYLC